MRLKNKVAIITGAGAGIGRGIALDFVKEGAKIVVADWSKQGGNETVRQVKKKKGKAIFIKTDVSNKEDVWQLVKNTTDEFGKIDILVNNAGIYPFVEFEKMPEVDWDKLININLKSVYLCAQAALTKMKTGGKIINISSIAAIKGFQNLAHYCASKGGVNALTRALAMELSPKKINVNAVAPGAIETPGAKTDEKTKKLTSGMIPWGRMGKPEDIAKVVSFLASSDAEYITGQVITVDGGWSVR